MISWDGCDVLQDGRQRKNDDDPDNQQLSGEGNHDNLREYTQIINVPIATWKALNEQLGRKDDQISALNERLKENQILFGREQDRNRALPSGGSGNNESHSDRIDWMGYNQPNKEGH